MMEGLKKRIRKRLREIGSNPARASVEAGLGKDYLRDIMRGKKTSISAEAAIALAGVLQCNVGWLLTGEGPVAVSARSLEPKLQILEQELDPAAYDRLFNSLDTILDGHIPKETIR